MRKLDERGVLPESEVHYKTPSNVAKKLFFYVTRCGHYYCDSNYDFSFKDARAQAESHRNYYLIYVKSGDMAMENDGNHFRTDAGQVALLDCRKTHRYRAMNNIETLWIHFDGPLADAFYEAILESKNGKQSFYSPAGKSTEEQMMKIIVGLRGDDTYSESEYSQIMYKILCDLLYSRQEAESDNDPITQSIRYIKDHLFEPLAVEDIARVVNLSTSHFSRLFKRRMCVSPHEFVILRRIDEAKSLLHTTNLSVKEIAYKVGYHSEVNFISSFISKTGMSPSMFRKHGN